MCIIIYILGSALKRQILRDTLIASRLKTLMLFDGEISAVNFNISIHRGVVYIQGVAAHIEQAERVVNHARNIKSVQNVQLFYLKPLLKCNSLLMLSESWKKGSRLMSYKVALQMDPIAQIDVVGDTSFALGLEAQNRGYDLFYYQPEELTLYAPDTVYAPLRPLSLRDQLTDFFTLGAPVTTNLREMDVVLMRQDPPFDMAYISATHFLEKITDDCLVVNNPSAVRNALKKLSPLYLKVCSRRLIMTRDRKVLEDFRAEHRDIILKPFMAMAVRVFFG